MLQGSGDDASPLKVLQELLHRYRALRRWPEGGRVYDLARQIVPLVIPITAETLDRARFLLERYPALTARDALHAAVAQIHGARAICSYDGAFDEIEGVERIEPPAAANGLTK